MLVLFGKKKHAKKAHKKHTIKKALRCLFYLVKKAPILGQFWSHSGPVLAPFWPGRGPILAALALALALDGGLQGSEDPKILGFWGSGTPDVRILGP